MFQKSIINSVKQDESKVALRWASFQKFLEKVEYIKTVKEEKYQDGFLVDIFENCLGYTLDMTNPKSFNLEREKKNETDGKKADGVIYVDDKVVGVIELKGQDTKNLDKIETQAFNYHASHSNSKYIIISNFDELRFYVDKKTAYEKFNLFTLNYEEFKKLHLLISYESIKDDVPLKLKEKSNSFEQDISKKLYKDFSNFRTLLFENIVKNNPTIDKQTLLRLTQKLCDRIIFILFAEDRDLLRANMIKEIREEFINQKFTNYSLYDIYKFYFEAINKGNDKLQIPQYNGGLFATDLLLDSLIIDDFILDENVQILSNYDFASEISVNILGHIFEQSLTDLEELQANIDNVNFDKTKSKRKKDGVFYTPEYITRYIVENTLGKMCSEKREELRIGNGILIPSNPKKLTKQEQQTKDNLQEYKNWLLNLKILDPACGSGAFLNQALEYLISEHKNLQNDLALMGDLFASYMVEEEILEHNLYGVDINEDAVEIAKLSLWLRTAKRGRPLTKLADKIVCANSLLEMPFSENSFDVVIGNPPYVDSESMSKSYKEERIFITKNYLTAVGNWDIFIPFVELGLRKLKDGQLLSFIIPNKILSARYGTALRSFINKNYSIVEIFDLSLNNVFEIDVYPIILTIQKTSQKENIKISFLKNEEIFSRFIKFQSEDNWALYNDINYELFSKISKRFEPLVLNKIYKLYSAASVSEAYEIKEFIQDNKYFDNNNNLKLINTGTIDPYVTSWGISDMTYIKDKYKYPVVNISNIKHKIWTKNPKIVFAGMSLRIEAFIDTQGDFLPLKSTTVLTAKTEIDLKLIGCILNSKLLTFIFRISNSANKMAGGYLNINQDNLGELPIPNFNNIEQKIPFNKKADLMLELNKKLQELKKNFINELNLEKVPTKLQKFEELDFDDFAKEYAKAKKLKFADKLEERNFKNEWQRLFENDKKEVLEIQNQINITDKEIDQMVYKLYDLTPDEIKIVEGV
ncbi:N-6 DNA methylase [Aliarcobacter skirrowii]|uniref:Eco57I restriction-modification methylase domain-containing protein n=1 Tax=Aliarcobacter skirrowii TaxID=28200 RepID=UPI0029AA5875|nr:N-6 DNA methylase [Aliarcobacter skirrowii]MDX4047746.1 N-6 DNA methylase [Aliarcobacter skirrowii]